MGVVAYKVKNKVLHIVDKKDLENVLETNQIITSTNENNKNNVYVTTTTRKKLSIVLVKTRKNNKITASIQKIDELLKYEYENGTHKKFEIIEMPLENYVEKFIKKETAVLTDLGFEEVLMQIVQSIVDKSEKKVKEEKIVTEYIEEKKDPVQFKKNIKERIMQIKRGEINNKFLIISGIENKVYLPYTIDELEEYLKVYPVDYKSRQEVVEKEFIVDYNNFFEKPARSRFKETFDLITIREGENRIIAFMYAIKMMMCRKVNAAIIASCKKKIELNNYLYFLQSGQTESFEYFTIIYDMVPGK